MRKLAEKVEDGRRMGKGHIGCGTLILRGHRVLIRPSDMKLRHYVDFGIKIGAFLPVTETLESKDQRQ